jgi:hypothetical protein
MALIPEKGKYKPNNFKLVMKYLIKATYLFIAGLMIVLLPTSCGEKIFTGDVDCSECYREKPDHADLVIDLTFDADFQAVPVVVYKGDVEDNQVMCRDTAFSTPYYCYVPVNARYSVRAEYKKGASTLFAIDGTKLKILLVTDACDAECYVIRGGKLNATIKKGYLDF